MYVIRKLWERLILINYNVFYLFTNFELTRGNP